MRPPDNTRRLLYPWDILVVTLFSLAIYYWAIYEGSQTTEEIEERIAEQAAPAEEEARRRCRLAPAGC